MHYRDSPGECPVCGAEHSACTRETGPITSVMLPNRDAARPAAPTVSEQIQATLPKGQVTTATYRGQKGKR